MKWPLRAPLRDDIGAGAFPGEACRDDDPLLRAVPAGFAEPTGVPVLLNTSYNGKDEPIAMGCYTRNGTVFTAATTDWSQALEQDARVARITRNVIERLLRTS